MIVGNWNTGVYGFPTHAQVLRVILAEDGLRSEIKIVGV